MITLPTKFQAEIDKGINAPAFLVKLEDGTLFNEQTLQADWIANSQNSQVDWLSQMGNVVVSNTRKPENLTGNAWVALFSLYEDGIPVLDRVWQSFKHTTTASKMLQEVAMFFRVDAAWPSAQLVECSIFAANKTTQIGTPVTAYVNSASGEMVSFNFSSQSLSIATGTTYWVRIGGILGTPSLFHVYYDSTRPYPDGQLDMTISSYAAGVSNGIYTEVGDAYFQVTLSGGYYDASGYIRTRNMDLGSTPANDGEWILEDIQPTGTSITYQAWASATGAFAGEETDLGAIIDGQAITNLKRYYRVKATLTASTDRVSTPTLQSIKAEFSTFISYSNHPNLGYDPAIMSVSALSTSIDTFKPSTIGQVTLTLALCDSVSTYIATKKPKNKLVKIKAGFVADGFVEADYVDYFWGQIDNWNITAKDEIVITVKDFSKEWDVDVPAAVSGQPLPTVEWGTAVLNHPIDVMLDILKNHINARDSKIVGSSFGTVKAALPGWVVKRTLKEDTVSGKDLMEELRKLTSTYFIPQPNGRIKIKKWDADEASIATLTDMEFIGKKWDSSAKILTNRIVHYYGWDCEGDEATDYNTVKIGVDTTSQSDWDETASLEVKDKWTPITQTAQSTDFLDKIIKRYANPPSALNVEVDLKYIYLEVGDLVTVTTVRAPSTDMAGISNIKFQITNKNLDFSKSKVSLSLLECASSVNTQVEAPVAQPTIYDLPDHVIGLAIVEQQHINYDGSYTPLIVVTYDLPTNSTYWSYALIQTSIDGGLTYKDYGIDYLQGNGFIIDVSKVGGYVGGTFEVRAVSVNKQGIAAPTATAPTAGLTKVGEGTVLITPPADITGLKIEGASDPNTTVWEGLKFSIVWNPCNQTAGGLTNEQKPLGAGLTSDPYWKYDEVEIWIGGLLRHTIQTNTLRYDYVYGDGQDAFLDALLVAANGTVTIKIRRWNNYNMVSGTRSLTITQVAPGTPSGLTGTGMSRSAAFIWDKNAEADFSHYSVRTKIGSGGTWSGWASIHSNNYLRTLTTAELTDGSLSIYIEVTAVDLYGNTSGTSTTNVSTWMIVPNELYTTLRTDFFVRDSIFYFATATLTWTAGSITRAAETFTLSASTLASANNKYVIATLSGGTATLSLADMTAGIPTLNANQVIIATTSLDPNSAGNYLCFIRQANSMQIEGAIIRDATILTAKIGDAQITNAKIIDLDVSKLNAGSITSKAITLAVADGTGDAKIQSGKTDFGDNTAGFILGIDDSDANKAKFEIGDASNYMKWNGSTLSIRGSLNADDIVAGTITGRILQTASSGKRFVVDVATNEAHFYGDRGDGTVEELASIGINSLGGSDYTILKIGGPNMSRYGIRVETAGSMPGVYSTTASNGTAIHGYSAMGIGGVFGCADSGIAPIWLYADETAGAPTHWAYKGCLFVDLNGILYINTTTGRYGYGGTWTKVGAQ